MVGWLKKEKPGSAGPDFSRVDTQAKAEDLARRGELHKLYLLPLEFGGQDVTPNVVYVPAFAVELKRDIDMNIVRPLIEEQKAKHYTAEPQYEGRSFVPCAITVVASDPADFRSVISIWGRAIEEK